MTRAEAVARLEGIASALEADISRAQTRDQHLALSLRLAEVRRLASDLAPTAPAAA